MAGLVVTLAPLVLLIANRDWFFTPEGFLDPWQYVGFFRLYEDLDYSPEEYKLARLPWILVGHAITRFMPTMSAAYVLHAIFLCALPLTLFGAPYVLLRRTSLSAVVALCLGFYTHMHGPGGWDYNNTPSGPLFLATLWVLVPPSSLRGGAAALTFAGVMAALTAAANLTTVHLFPALLYVHPAAARAESGRRASGRALKGGERLAEPRVVHGPGRCRPRRLADGARVEAEARRGHEERTAAALGIGADHPGRRAR